MKRRFLQLAIMLGAAATAVFQSSASEHWAFVAPERPAPPAVKNAGWVRTPVDRFILGKLESLNLSPSAPAERTALIRRLSLDLTGLPPALSEVDRFVNDASPDAAERLVERLLASPHYGEKWARWWLDAARYADTNGFEKDLPRPIWPYRDWVISAFNRDMPFDRFAIEQIAGDLLPDATLETRIATGFLRNSMLNQEGGIDPEQFRVEGLVDRVDAIGNAFLGLTVKCAQCHTHKFDPIKHEEYYRFYAFLNNDDEAEIEAPDETLRSKRENITREITRIEDDLMRDPDLPRRMKEWEERERNSAGNWSVLAGATAWGTIGAKFIAQDDGSFLFLGDNNGSYIFTIKAASDLKRVTGFRLELLADPNLPLGGPGRGADGLCSVAEFTVEAAPANSSDKEGAKRIELVAASADFEQAEMPVKNAIDGEQNTSWGIDAGPLRRNQSRKAVFVAKQPIAFDSGAAFTFQISQRGDGPPGYRPSIGRFRLSVTSDEAPQADPLPERVRRIIVKTENSRTTEDRREVFRYYRTIDPKFDEANRRIDALMKDWGAAPTSLVIAPRETPRTTRIFRRGDWKRPSDAVEPGTPAFLHPFPEGAPKNRLGLAQWIVDKRNPLTARVIVNRVWQQYFGEGLVPTPDDFGTRCDAPSHPELLDWLSAEFMESGWSFKHLHRLIVNSATYRQSAVLRPDLREADPTNRWLARAPRFRVEAETVRDIALAAAGLLSARIGGPSVYPPIPDGVLNLGYGSPMKWETSRGEERYRRAMYTFWKRSVPYPSLLVFDQPNGDFSCTRRIRSNTPLQALTTLNDTVFMEAAQGLALRVYKEGGSDDAARMEFAFRLCTSRRPDASEKQRLMEFLRSQQQYFSGRTAEAVYVTSADLNNIPEGVDLHRVAPWTMVARVLLNLDETITRE
ncbi:MAG: DUF1553 domain-containing protein [Blastocatellales bacterium]|nr:DUF1553 domain-containing protein [Blastocatellales bacterium]